MYGGFPDEYQEVEYIESTGTQYIDTGFKPNQDTKLEIKIYPTLINKGIWSSDSGSTLSTNFTGYTNINGNFRFGNKTVKTTMQANLDYTIIQSKNGLIINENHIGDYTGYSDFTSNANLKIGYNTNGFVGRIYYFKLWDNDVLVRNMISCYRKSDNVIGMYDVVNNAFYTNSGTGTFLRGNEL